MTFGGDDRAVAVQIGAVILLGFLVVSLSLYQATVVPDENGRVEFQHSQQVQESLQDLRNGILRTVSAGRTSPTTVSLGTRYPTRVVAVNPPPSSGRLATEAGGNVTLVNAKAIDDETADYWNGSDQEYDTRRLSYQPNYNVYQSAPRTTYANSVLYNEFDNGNNASALTDQRLLEGNLIYVVTLDGSYGQSGTRAVSVSPTPVSASDRTVAVEGDISINVTTELTEGEWERLLEDQYESNGGRIEGNAGGVTVTGDTLTVDLVPGKTYRLRMAKVGVGTDVTDTSEQYLTIVDGADSVTAGGTRRIVLEVRDSYNNPVSGVTVEAAVDGANAEINPMNGTSDGQGRIVYEYSAPDSVSSARTDSINFTFNTPVGRPDFSGGEPESARLDVTVVSLRGGNGEGGASNQLEFETLEEADNNGRLRFRVRNTGAADATVTRFSVSDGPTSDILQLGNNPELEITQISTNGEANARGEGNSYETNGEIFDLSNQAIIDPDELARVKLEAFQIEQRGNSNDDVNLSGLQYTPVSGDSDITVTLYLSDGSSKDFYFEFR